MFAFSCTKISDVDELKTTHHQEQVSRSESRCSLKVLLMSGARACVLAGGGHFEHMV